MFKKIIIVLALLILAGFALAGMWEYRQYKNRLAERQARLAKQSEEVKVVIKEGETLQEIAEQFDELGMFDADNFIRAAKNFDISQYNLIAKPKSSNGLEGYLFPDTYRFSKNSTAEEVIGKMLDNFDYRLRSIGIKTSDNQIIPGYDKLTLAGSSEAGLNLYQILTLASIVEQESGGKGSASGDMSLEEERALVAGVFYNRLTIGQALESDATINYITGKNAPSSSLDDLQTKSAYNTYKNAGLPPGPIGNPSLGSIEAVLKPIKSDYFYFLHYQPSGKVDFSKTFSEHVKKKTAL